MHNSNDDNTVRIYNTDETFIKIDTNRGILKEISEHFCFEIPNARFHPKVKNKMWDGKLRLLNLNTRKIYKGLLKKVIEFCNDNGYKVVIDKTLHNLYSKKQTIHTDEILDNFIQSITLDGGLIPHDYQIEAFKHSIQSKRSIILSPTASGKSLIIYFIIRYLLENDLIDKLVICVPTIDLVGQLTDEFVNYDKSYNIAQYCHQIYSGKDKDDKTKKVIISTWQSIFEQSETFFEKFDCVILDECHLAKANSLKYILESSINAHYKLGFTGTLDGMDANELVIEGLTGPVHETITTTDMMDRGIVSSLTIECILLKYDNQFCDLIKNFTYHKEKSWILENDKRNNVIFQLGRRIIAARKNGLILTDSKNHIKQLHKLFKDNGLEDKVFIVTGDTEKEIRAETRKFAQLNDGYIILATYGVYSTGINIKNLQYLILGSPTKSIIRLLQSIGRGLRLDGKFNKFVVFDIIDNLKHGKRNNYFLKHFLERSKIYTNQKFNYKITNINI